MGLPPSLHFAVALRWGKALTMHVNLISKGQEKKATCQHVPAKAVTSDATYASVTNTTGEIIAYL